MSFAPGRMPDSIASFMLDVLTPKSAATSAGVGAASTQQPPVVPSQPVTVTYTVSGTTITLHWTAIAGAVGYEFLLDGKRVSNTWDGSSTSHAFTIPDTASHTYEVVALKVADDGKVVYSSAAPPPPTSGSVLWNGNLETENATFTAQWNGIQQKAAGRVTLATSPVRKGSKSARFYCATTDTNVAGSGNGIRAEIVKGNIPSFGVVGKTSYVSFSWLFDPSYQPEAGSEWNFFHQVHDNLGGTQACAAYVYGTQLKWKVWGATNTVTKAVLVNGFQRGVWYDFVLGYTWGKTFSDGAIEAWVQRGSSVTHIPRVACPTLYTGSTGVYLKAGWYSGGTPVAMLGWGDCYQVSDSLAAAVTAFPSWG